MTEAIKTPYDAELRKLGGERIQELNQEISKCERVNRYLTEELHPFDPENGLIPVVFDTYLEYLETMDTRIADLKRRRDAILAEPLGDCPKNGEERSLEIALVIVKMTEREQP